MCHKDNKISMTFAFISILAIVHNASVLYNYEFFKLNILFPINFVFKQ